MKLFLCHPQSDHFNFNDIFSSHIIVLWAPLYICRDCPLTVWLYLGFWDLQLGDREVENIRNCQFLLSTKVWCQIIGMLDCTLNKLDLTVRPCQEDVFLVIRIDLYKLSDINKECEEREREDLTERITTNIYLFIRNLLSVTCFCRQR